MFQFSLSHPENLVTMGILCASNIQIQAPNLVLEARLQACLDLRTGKELGVDEELIRSQSRDMLRFQSYKPTGRAKPASEYLLRTAQEGQFPRINTLVDINNYISMKYVLPISVWDIDKAQTESFVFRPGREQEAYVFNPTGQTIEVLDLIAGFRVIDGNEEPIVNPVKDSMLTKTNNETTRIAVGIYFPKKGNPLVLENALTEFEELIHESGGTVDFKAILV